MLEEQHIINIFVVLERHAFFLRAKLTKVKINMVKENNMKRQQGCTPSLDYSRSKGQNYASGLNLPIRFTESEMKKMENTKSDSRLKGVREIVERSELNDRRGQKSRNLYAVDTFDRRTGDRRQNVDSSID